MCLVVFFYIEQIWYQKHYVPRQYEYIFNNMSLIFLFLQIVPDWKDNKLIQTIQPVQSHMKPHVIEMYVNSDGDLVQVITILSHMRPHSIEMYVNSDGDLVQVMPS